MNTLSGLALAIAFIVLQCNVAYSEIGNGIVINSTDSPVQIGVKPLSGSYKQFTIAASGSIRLSSASSYIATVNDADWTLDTRPAIDRLKLCGGGNSENRDGSLPSFEYTRLTSPLTARYYYIDVDSRGVHRLYSGLPPNWATSIAIQYKKEMANVGILPVPRETDERENNSFWTEVTNGHREAAVSTLIKKTIPVKELRISVFQGIHKPGATSEEVDSNKPFASCEEEASPECVRFIKQVLAECFDLRLDQTYVGPPCGARILGALALADLYQKNGNIDIDEVWRMIQNAIADAGLESTGDSTDAIVEPLILKCKNRLRTKWRYDTAKIPTEHEGKTVRWRFEVGCQSETGDDGKQQLFVACAIRIQVKFASESINYFVDLDNNQGFAATFSRNGNLDHYGRMFSAPDELAGAVIKFEQFVVNRLTGQ